MDEMYLNVRCVLGAYYLYCNFVLAILEALKAPELFEVNFSEILYILNHKIDTLNCISCFQWE